MISERRRATAGARLGRLLAFLAALALTIGLHPPHALAASGPSDHGHFSASCAKADIEQPAQTKTGAAPSGHIDCTPLFHPLLRTPQEWTLAFSTLTVPLPRAERFRHFVVTFDPPPPRGAA